MNSKTLWITRTAIFIALLVLVQFITKSLGQFVTGSCVNFVLVAATLVGGLSSGLIVALVSPFLAFMLGIGPVFIQLVPMVAIGNAVLALIYGLLLKNGKNLIRWIIAVPSAALLKFAALYFGIVKLVLPIIPGIKPPQVAAMSATFSWPQLVTALIGGVLASLLVPQIQKALKK